MTTIPPAGVGTPASAPPAKPAASSRAASVDPAPRAAAGVSAARATAREAAAIAAALAELGGPLSASDPAATATAPPDVAGLVAGLNPDKPDLSAAITDALTVEAARELAQSARAGLSAQPLNITNQTPQRLAGLAA